MIEHSGYPAKSAALRDSAWLNSKRCRNADRHGELSLLPAVIETGVPSLELRRHPQDLHHTGGKSVKVNECSCWTREGKELPVYFKIGPLPLLSKLERWLSPFCRPEAAA